MLRRADSKLFCRWAGVLGEGYQPLATEDIAMMFYL